MASAVISMQSWQSVVVCVAVTLLCHGAVAYPREVDEADPSSAKARDDDLRLPPGGLWIPLETSRKHDSKEDLEDLPKKPASAEDIKDIKLEIPQEKGVPQGQPLAEKNEKALVKKVESESKEDATRSKKSPDMRDLSSLAHPTTTVCIQVRPDHGGSPVIQCGSQIDGDKKEKMPMPTSPRYAFPAQAYYDPRSMRGEIPLPQPSHYMRVSADDIEPSHPFSSPGKQMMKPQQISPQGLPTMPKAARGPNMFRRTQPEDNNMNQPEGAKPVVPSQPYRIVPQNPPASVVVHKQYYQAAPLPTFANNLIGPASTPLRFNCALQPEGAQFLSTYGSPMLRSSAPAMPLGYIPVGEEMIIPDVPTSRNAPVRNDYQEYYLEPQGRAAQMNEMDYADEPYVGATFVGEDGQLYMVDNSQARAVDDREKENLKPSSKDSLTMEALRANSEIQEKKLKEATETLLQLQQQIKEVKEEAKKKLSPVGEITKEPSPDRESPEEPKKQSKNTKRQSYLMTRE